MSIRIRLSYKEKSKMNFKNAKHRLHRKCDYNKDSFWTHHMDIRKYHQKKWMHLCIKNTLLSVKAAVEVARTKQINLQGGLMKTLFFYLFKEKVLDFFICAKLISKAKIQSTKRRVDIERIVFCNHKNCNNNKNSNMWQPRDEKRPGDQSMWFKSQSFPSLIRITPDNAQHKAKFCSDPSY